MNFKSLNNAFGFGILNSMPFEAEVCDFSRGARLILDFFVFFLIFFRFLGFPCVFLLFLVFSCHFARFSCEFQRFLHLCPLFTCSSMCFLFFLFLFLSFCYNLCHYQ